MKKKTALIFILTLIVFIVSLSIQQQLSEASDQNKVIPKNAIRLRILANSDHANDQQIKRRVRDIVNHQIETWVKDLKSERIAKKVIQAHLPAIRTLVKQELKKERVDQTYTVKLGEADFPTKLYGGTVYPAGTYQALVITLGSGQGANWWCVLFPPLCFLDFSHGDAVTPDMTKSPGASPVAPAATSTAPNEGSGTSSVSTDPEPATHPQAVEAEASTETTAAPTSVTHNSKASGSTVSQSSDTAQTGTEQIKVKFFVWEWAKKAAQLFQ